MLAGVWAAWIVIGGGRLVVAGRLGRIIARHRCVPGAVTSMLTVARTWAHHSLGCLRSEGIFVLNVV